MHRRVEQVGEQSVGLFFRPYRSRRPGPLAQKLLAEGAGQQVLAVETQQPRAAIAHDLLHQRPADALAAILLEDEQIGELGRVDTRQFAALDQQKTGDEAVGENQPGSCQ